MWYSAGPSTSSRAERKTVYDHLYEVLTSLFNLIAIVIATANRVQIRRLHRRQKAQEIRERLAKSRG
jgi:hypothetical protein